MSPFIYINSSNWIQKCWLGVLKLLAILWLSNYLKQEAGCLHSARQSLKEAQRGKLFSLRVTPVGGLGVSFPFITRPLTEADHREMERLWAGGVRDILPRVSG